MHFYVMLACLNLFLYMLNSFLLCYILNIYIWSASLKFSWCIYLFKIPSQVILYSGVGCFPMIMIMNLQFSKFWNHDHGSYSYIFDLYDCSFFIAKLIMIFFFYHGLLLVLSIVE
jgi:hypothetical protein